MLEEFLEARKSRKAWLECLRKYPYTFILVGNNRYGNASDGTDCYFVEIADGLIRSAEGLHYGYPDTNKTHNITDY